MHELMLDKQEQHLPQQTAVKNPGNSPAGRVTHGQNA